MTINQTKAPFGTADGTSQFQELGVFFPTLSASGTGTLTVVLNASSANGTVVADAIGAAPGWASTGGPTPFEAEPSYQLPFQSTGYRTTPDVSFDASFDGGATTFDDGNLSFGSGGTSLGSPCWAGLIAIANQGRVAAGGTTFNSSANPQQILQAIYSLPASDFHDITTGYNGFKRGVGYDEVTGRGTPIANLLVPNLVSYGIVANQATPTINWPAPAAITYGTPLQRAKQLDATASYGGVTVAGTFTYSPVSGAILTAGSQTLSVTFTPTDSTDFTTASAQTTLVVNQATPTIGLSASIITPVYGQPEQFTAMVGAGFVGGAVPTGSVQFQFNSGRLTAPYSLSSGDATSNPTAATFLLVGTTTITAIYSGDTNYASGSFSIPVTVTPAHLAVVPDNVTTGVGQAPNLTWHYTGFVGNDTAASAGITGTPVLSTNAANGDPLGTYTIGVTSAGNLSAANYDFPTADFGTATLTVVQQAAPTLNVSLSTPNPVYGQTLTFLASASGASGSPTPTGSFQFLIDGNPSGQPVALTSGTASYTPSTFLMAGAHAVSVVYSGDGVYPSTTSNVVAFNVAKKAASRSRSTPRPRFTAHRHRHSPHRTSALRVATTLRFLSAP